MMELHYSRESEARAEVVVNKKQGEPEAVRPRTGSRAPLSGPGPYGQMAHLQKLIAVTLAE